MRSLIGCSLGAYEVIELIGRGGMAEVYKAYDRRLERYAALKLLLEFLAQDSTASARFLAEARNMAKLRHQHIVPIYAYDEQDGLSYFVMELVEGGTLKDRMGSPMEPEQAALLIGQIADALAYAHEKGFVHRDVKPANILMLKPDWTLLADLGIARALEQISWVSHTSTGISGTPHYMAPEQALGKPVSPKTDQYALGIVFYQMLAGAPPYKGDTPMALVAQHIHSTPPPPSERNPEIPEAVEQVVMRALEKDPDARFPHMAAFAEAARAATLGENLAPSPAAPLEAANALWETLPSAGWAEPELGNRAKDQALGEARREPDEARDPREVGPPPGGKKLFLPRLGVARISVATVITITVIALVVAYSGRLGTSYTLHPTLATLEASPIPNSRQDALNYFWGQISPGDWSKYGVPPETSPPQNSLLPGIRVTLTAEMKDLQGKEIYFRWTVVHDPDGTPVKGYANEPAWPWQNLRADNEDQSNTADYWVAVPPQPGTYRVTFTAYLLGPDPLSQTFAGKHGVDTQPIVVHCSRLYGRSTCEVHLLG